MNDKNTRNSSIVSTQRLEVRQQNTEIYNLYRENPVKVTLLKSQFTAYEHLKSKKFALKKIHML